MTESTLDKALRELGFTDGWAISGDTIVLWENTEPQPTEAELIKAGWVKPDEALIADAQPLPSPE
jgi:hypothetical protein